MARRCTGPAPGPGDLPASHGTSPWWLRRVRRDHRLDVVLRAHPRERLGDLLEAIAVRHERAEVVLLPRGAHELQRLVVLGDVAGPGAHDRELLAGDEP